MAEFFSIDFGAVLPILIERVLSLFNKDPELEEWKERFSRRIQLSMEEAYSVQCVGMRKPIPIIDIYQQLHLLNPSRETVTVESVFRSGDDAIIFAGPGRGKTTLLRWLFFQFAGDQGRLPLLYITIYLCT